MLFEVYRCLQLNRWSVVCGRFLHRGQRGEGGVFRRLGYLLSLSAAFYMFVRYFSPSLPMCLRCFMLMLSGPVELLFLLL